MDIEALHNKFFEAKKVYDLDAMTNCLMEACWTYNQMAKAPKRQPAPKQLLEILDHINILIYASLKALSDHEGTNARNYIYCALLAQPDLSEKFMHILFILAIVNYQIGNFDKADSYINNYMLIRSDLWHDEDEIALFYSGNICVAKDLLHDAAKAYKKCLDIKKSFTEAADNLNIVTSIIDGKDTRDALKNIHLDIEYSLLNVDSDDEAACFNIPIFINARDRVGVMKQLIDWLLDAGYTNIIILDNKSTYPPLIDYYNSFNNDSRVKVVYLKKNFGFKSIWISGILEELDIKTPYVYTDPDVVPIDSCPKNVVQLLLKILQQNRFIRKAGLGLIYDDITFYNKDFWQKLESSFYHLTDVAPNIHFVQLDTTFALYCNCRHYNLRLSIRTVGDLRALHLPWYFDYDNLPDDERYYIDHADNLSSSVGTHLRNEKNNSN
ncbi:MAG: hypothetical protein IJ797_10195 [Selenomonadaceae bacterium]|nr:hypothetical protein [Selenomonadaceae bacterium]